MSFLVGVKEVGEILGWDRRKVSTYHSRGVLPKPVTSLSSGPIWFRKQIEHYKSSKESNLPTYYIKDGVVYECKFNRQMLETSFLPDGIKNSIGSNIVYTEEDIALLERIIQEKNPISQFLSFETINFLHDLGILNTSVFQEYCNQYLCENHKKEDELS